MKDHFTDPFPSKQSIVKIIGAELYESVCAEARKDAIRPNYGTNSIPYFNSDLPHKIETYIWDYNGTYADKLKLFKSIYEDMPCYGLLMYSNHHYGNFSHSEKLLFWDYVVEWISSTDLALANPMLYSLWVDYFEDTETVEESWTRIISSTLTDTALKRLLNISGPVPWTHKMLVFKRILDDPKWHEHILKSILISQFDVCGSINKRQARKLLRSLHVNKETHEWEKLNNAIRPWYAL